MDGTSSATSAIGRPPVIPLPAPIELPAGPSPIDPTEALLATPAGRLVEGHAGDLCSALGIIGAATIVAARRAPTIEMVGERIVLGSMVAGGTDTAIQARNVVKDDGEGAQERGNPKSSLGSIAYAATGMIPAASIAAIRGFHPHPSRAEVAALAMLGVNGAMVGYELVTRVPKIVRGEEDASGYGSLLASLGGFVVASHLMRR